MLDILSVCWIYMKRAILGDPAFAPYDKAAAEAGSAAAYTAVL